MYIRVWREGVDNGSGEEALELALNEGKGRRHTPSHVSWLQEGFSRLRGSRAYYVLVRPSMLSIAGATIGIISMALLTWVSHQVMEADTSYLPRFHYVTERSSFFDLLTMSEPAVTVALSLFLGGTVLAFIIPASSILQGLGLLGFMLRFRSEVFEDPQLGLGYYLAIVSTVVLFISCLSYHALHRRSIEDHPVPAIGRIAALSPYATRFRK